MKESHREGGDRGEGHKKNNGGCENKKRRVPNPQETNFSTNIQPGKQRGKGNLAGIKKTQ